MKTVTFIIEQVGEGSGSPPSKTEKLIVNGVDLGPRYSWYDYSEVVNGPNAGKVGWTEHGVKSAFYGEAPSGSGPSYVTRTVSDSFQIPSELRDDNIALDLLQAAAGGVGKGLGLIANSGEALLKFENMKKAGLEAAEHVQDLQQIYGEAAGRFWGEAAQDAFSQEHLALTGASKNAGKLLKGLGAAGNVLEGVAKGIESYQDGNSPSKAMKDASVKIGAALLAGAVGEFVGTTVTGAALLVGGAALGATGLPVVLGVAVGLYVGYKAEGIVEAWFAEPTTATGVHDPSLPSKLTKSRVASNDVDWRYDVKTGKFTWLDKNLEKQFEKYATILDVNPKPVDLKLVGDKYLDKNDYILGHGGNDTLLGKSGNDVLSGAARNDSLSGGAGNDALHGDGGKDTLNGGAGNDFLFGGKGNDLLIGGTGKDFMDGGAGLDTVSYAAARKGVHVYNMESPQANFVAGAESIGDTLRNVERIIGSKYNDTIGGGDRNDRLEGGKGNDVLHGWVGADTMTGGAGRDYFAFNGIDQVGMGKGKRDVITDFNSKYDKLDFTMFSTDPDDWFAQMPIHVLGKQGAKFTGREGEFRWYQDDRKGMANDRTIIECDTDGDRKADFQIELVGLVKLKASNFYVDPDFL